MRIKVNGRRGDPWDGMTVADLLSALSPEPRRERMRDDEGRNILDLLDLDRYALLPDPVGTLEACAVLKKEGFTVLCYTSDDPVMALRLKEAGADSVMPAGAPIGSGQGVLNPYNVRIILEQLKEGDLDYPVIVDAGVGTASDVTIAMELGADGVLLNTGVAGAKDPVAMARAMRHAIQAGYIARRAGRIPRKLHATASSSLEGVVGSDG
jgi:thiazole synthase